MQQKPHVCTYAHIHALVGVEAGAPMHSYAFNVKEFSKLICIYLFCGLRLF